MPRSQPKRKKGRHRGAGGRANADLTAHIASLGLKTVEQYRAWRRDNGLSGALNKSWQERRQERTLAQKLKQEKAEGAALMRHVKLLGLKTVDEYRAWCLRHNLSDALHKSPQQQKKERDLLVRLKSDAALAGMKQHARRPADTIRLIYSGELAPAALKRHYLQKIHDAFARLRGDRRARKALLELLLHAEQHADLFGVKPAISRFGPQEGNTFIEGLGALAGHHKRWLRAPNTWRPDSHNTRRQFGALARHLLARYDVPTFMDAAWFQPCSESTRQQQGWFIHIGIGQNIRTADIPVALTKKMAHLFLQAPDGYTVEEALRRGQILGLGGEEPLVRAVNGTRLGSVFENEDFWKTVIHFFVNNPMLDPDQVGPVVDYIYNQKYVPQEIALPGGGVETRPPPQPNFAVKGRSMDKLLRQVEAWHRQLARDARLPHQEWKPSGIDPFEYRAKNAGTGEEVHWTIQELLTSKELAAEGRIMHHCVRSYASNCRKGNTSIWSMQVEDAHGGPHRVMTIAVNNGSRGITQARGRYNALPSGKVPNGRRRTFEKTYAYYLRQTRHILALWRQQEGLTMSGRP